jgi:hypothetical protein
MVDDLHALGENVTDRHLVHNLLHVLNKRFDHIKIFIKPLITMTSNSRRSSWTTWWPRDKPLCSTPCPQEEGTLHSSCYLRAHHSRNHRVLRLPLPLLPQTPTMAAKARVRARRRGKERTMAPPAPVTTAATMARAPRRDPRSTIPRLAPCPCGQRCILHSSSWRIHRSTPSLLH